MNRKSKLLIMKIVSLFSVIRGYNIPIIILAQYLSAIFILAPENKPFHVILDINLFLIVLATAFSIASGYIINSFYDSKKDLINRPNKTTLDRLVSQKTKLNVYFTLNFVVAFLAILISWRAFLYFSVYIFLIWFYSHKIKKFVIVGNLMATLMAILPFFALLLYYKNFYEVIICHATFLFLLLLIREMIKDLENIKGDLANDYKTIPILYGEITSKKIITFLTLLTVIPVYLLIEKFEIGNMDLYFYSCLLFLLLFVLKLWKSDLKEHYLFLHNLLKFLIVAGVFSIILINPSLILNFWYKIASLF
jgi:4-hydroxybenzoate polyprenyltransferase